MIDGVRAYISYPTDPFAILDPQHQEIWEFYEVQKRRATDFEAPKLWKDRSGMKGFAENSAAAWAQTSYRWFPI